MGYDRGDSFPFDFEHKWNSIWFRKCTGKQSPRSYPIECERKWKYSFVSVAINGNLEYTHRGHCTNISLFEAHTLNDSVLCSQTPNDQSRRIRFSFLGDSSLRRVRPTFFLFA